MFEFDIYDRVRAVFTDGGCALGSRSHIGVSWAWVGVSRDREEIIRRSSYWQAPENDTLTNNQAELMAVIQALEELPSGWQGIILSDSKITLGRVFENWARNGITEDQSERLDAVLKKHNDMRGIRQVLLQGHPMGPDYATIKLPGVRERLEREYGAEIAHYLDGIGRKRDLPISRHNESCDALCTEEVRLLKQNYNYRIDSELENLRGKDER